MAIMPTPPPQKGLPAQQLPVAGLPPPPPPQVGLPAKQLPVAGLPPPPVGIQHPGGFPTPGGPVGPAPGSVIPAPPAPVGGGGGVVGGGRSPVGGVGPGMTPLPPLTQAPMPMSNLRTTAPIAPTASLPRR